MNLGTSRLAADLRLVLAFGLWGTFTLPLQFEFMKRSTFFCIKLQNRRYGIQSNLFAP
jgi:hypothetical protein